MSRGRENPVSEAATDACPEVPKLLASAPTEAGRIGRYYLKDSMFSISNRIYGPQGVRFCP